MFLGYHILTGSEVSTKVVRRRNIEEKVGVYVNVNGKDAIIEYSDMDKAYMEAVDEEEKSFTGQGILLYMHSPLIL